MARTEGRAWHYPCPSLQTFQTGRVVERAKHPWGLAGHLGRRIRGTGVDSEDAVKRRVDHETCLGGHLGA